MRQVSKSLLIKFFAISLVGICSAFVVHPVHISVTEIEYDDKEKELEIMMRIFLDDLETAVRQHQHKGDLDILHPTAPLTTEKLISAYVAEHFSLTLDKKLQPVKYLGQELEGEAVICYLLVPNVKKWTSIAVTNSILQELHDDQSNLVHVTVGGTVKSLRLVSENASGAVSF